MGNGLILAPDFFSFKDNELRLNPFNRRVFSIKVINITLKKTHLN